MECRVLGRLIERTLRFLTSLWKLVFSVVKSILTNTANLPPKLLAFGRSIEL